MDKADEVNMWAISPAGQLSLKEAAKIIEENNQKLEGIMRVSWQDLLEPCMTATALEIQAKYKDALNKSKMPNGEGEV